MNREILFRGKRLDDGEWVEGNLFIPDKVTRTDAPTEILMGTNIVRISYAVDPSTVGQYTGLTDRNGTKIFDGDLLNGFTYPFLDPDGHTHNYFAEVCWDNAEAVFYILTHKHPLSAVTGISEGNTELMGEYDRTALEIIGNIHDNPELLNGGAKDA